MYQRLRASSLAIPLSHAGEQRGVQNYWYSHIAGLMFWLWRNKFVGSYFCFTSARRG